MTEPAKLKQIISGLKPHIFFWTLFIMYEFAVSYYFSNGKLSFWVEYIVFYSLNISLFYSHAYMVSICTRDGQPKYFLILLGTIAELAMYLLIRFFIEKYLLRSLDPHINPMKFIVGASWRAFYFIMLSFAFAFGNLTVHYVKRISSLDKQVLTNQLNQEKLEKSLLITENAFLKAQVNPHFLFNILSFVHSNVIPYSEKLADMIVILANMMRYAFLETSADGKIAVEVELEQIESYILLNQYRFDNQLKIDFNVVGDFTYIRIIPLLLLTIIENVFKYGDLSNEKQPATITIMREEDFLILHIFNAKSDKKQNFSTGIGMVNVERRLKQFYNKYDLRIEQNELTYQLILKIDISND